MKTTTYECPHCSRMQPTGTFKRNPSDKNTDPFRVTFFEEKGSWRGVTASSLEMARASACGHEGATIETLEP